MYKLSSYPKINVSRIHALNHKNAIVMLSGGIDSTVALWWALDNYESVRIITVNYNQAHQEELVAAKHIAELTDCDYKLISVDIPDDFWALESHITRGQACLMTSIAGLSISNDGADIVEGILLNDNYGDCDRDFLDYFAQVLFHRNDINPIGIATPLRAVENKADVIAMGFVLGAPLVRTWTCREPINGNPCNRCMQCGEKNKAIDEFEKKYGISWETVCTWQNILGSPYHPVVRTDISESIKCLIEGFRESGIMEKSYPIYKYLAPDNLFRVASILRNIPNNVAEIDSRGISVHGYTNDYRRWEVCVLENGEIATTDYVPPVMILESELKKKIGELYK